MLFYGNNLSDIFLFLKKMRGRKQTFLLMFMVLVITLIQYCEINKEYSNNLINSFAVLALIMLNMLYAFILSSENICIRERRSRRIEWFLANGIPIDRIVNLITISEFMVVVIVETFYLCIIMLLAFIRVISLSFLCAKTFAALIIINLIFYQFADIMNILFLITKKPENIKVVLLMGFMSMSFIISLFIYLISVFGITHIDITGLIMAAGMALLILRKIKRYMLHNRFKEKVTLSFSE